MHKFKILIQFFVVTTVCISVYYITERNKGRTANELLLDFHEKPTPFNEMFMKFYVSYIKDGNLLC